MKHQTTNHSESAPLDQRSLDRLVDGQLSASEYHQLLNVIAEHPDGWRQCASSFLEAQAWQQALSRMAEEPAAVSPPAKLPTTRHTGRLRSWPWLALAATLAIAFVSSRLTPVRNGLQSPTPLASDVLPYADSTVRESRPSESLQYVNHQFWDGGPAISPQMRDYLQRMNVQVRQRHVYIPLIEPSGRRFLVPVEEVQLRPASQEPY